MPWPNELPKIVATWWPEGEGRDFATEFMKQCYTPRQQWMNRPHIVHPKYRGKGVGTLLMDWGTNMADKLGLEGFIENSHEIVNQPGKEKRKWRMEQVAA
ncbi:hypothetical protein BCON_0043g00470 [Botryotinia convoluta]|uniref:N-acetyltransferase domain-containing protein n=1 Tax=Botryotinia convoluta TaxID=54673 RepID=A0A4Z1IDR6_9HELO|nr:hypothetical protein BCON_0043g00470 [Botryotinia convoluta]